MGPAKRGWAAIVAVLAVSAAFSAGNVDPRTGAIRRDRLILSWFGVTNFAVATVFYGTRERFQRKTCR